MRAEPRSTIETATTYIPVAPIAKGGLGSVELVLRREGRFRRLYALKRLHGHLRDDPDIRDMFLEEGRLAGYLRHPNAVSVLDVGEDVDGPFLLMDFVDGLSLATVIRELVARGDLVPLGVGLRIVHQAAEGLRAAHELVADDGSPSPLVHRDVSPQNILLGFDGIVRVADFGIAKAVGGDGVSTTNALKGKYGYMSPEQLRFERVDPRADLFSLGVVLYELLSGSRLFPGNKLEEVARRILHDPPPEVASVRGDATPEVEALVFRLLAKDRDRRVGSARELLASLEPIVADVESRDGRVDVREYLASTFGELHDRRRGEREEAVRSAIARHSGREEEEPGGAADDSTFEVPVGVTAERPSKRPGRRRWVWVAVSVGVLTAAVVVYVAAGGGDGEAPADDAGAEAPETLAAPAATDEEARVPAPSAPPGPSDETLASASADDSAGADEETLASESGGDSAGADEDASPAATDETAREPAEPSVRRKRRSVQRPRRRAPSMPRETKGTDPLSDWWEP